MHGCGEGWLAAAGAAGLHSRKVSAGSGGANQRGARHPGSQHQAQISNTAGSAATTGREGNEHQGVSSLSIASKQRQKGQRGRREQQQRDSSQSGKSQKEGKAMAGAGKTRGAELKTAVP